MREVHVQLEGAPEAFFRLLFIARADEKIQRLRGTCQEIRGDVSADIPGGSGQEDSHSGQGLRASQPEQH